MHIPNQLLPAFNSLQDSKVFYKGFLKSFLLKFQSIEYFPGTKQFN